MGGGAVRTAAKVAAIAGARRSYLSPATSAAASSVHVALIGDHHSPDSISASGKAVLYPAGSQWPVMEVDDWELAGGREVELFGSDLVDPHPRIVFGSVPTLEEAKEATSELREALDKTYFSSRLNGDPAEASQVSEPAGTAAILPSVPKHVAQTFSLLQGSPEAQNVVASLASGKNVWEAIMKNEKVMDFYRSHLSQNVHPEGSEFQSTESSTGTAESPLKETSEGAGVTGWLKSAKLKVAEIGVTGWLKSAKLKVTEIVTNFSDFIQDYMGASDSKSQQDTATSANTGDGYTFGAAFMAMAIITILLVLVRRG